MVCVCGSCHFTNFSPPHRLQSKGNWSHHMITFFIFYYRPHILWNIGASLLIDTLYILWVSTWKSAFSVRSTLAREQRECGVSSHMVKFQAQELMCITKISACGNQSTVFKDQDLVEQTRVSLIRVNHVACSV